MDFFSVFCYTIFISAEGGKVLKNKTRKIRKLLTADNIILTISTFLLVFYAAIEIVIRFSPAYQINALIRAVVLVLICLIFYCGGRLRLQRLGDLATLRRLFYLFFALYLYLILSFTLMDATLGRTGDFIFNNIKFNDQREHYIKWFVNIVPFRSIYEVYILGFVKGYLNAYYVILNLLGNICLFMPFAFFLPLFFKRQRKWYFFIPTLLACITLVEGLQFLFMVGSCDIDDVILNATGAILLYFIFKTPVFKKLCFKILVNTFD